MPLEKYPKTRLLRTAPVTGNKAFARQLSLLLYVLSEHVMHMSGGISGRQTAVSGESPIIGYGTIPCTSGGGALNTSPVYSLRQIPSFMGMFTVSNAC